jgi:hypothetical protein
VEQALRPAAKLAMARALATEVPAWDWPLITQPREGKRKIGRVDHPPGFSVSDVISLEIQSIFDENPLAAQYFPPIPVEQN